MSDPQILTLDFRLVRNICTYEGMTKAFSWYPKARETQKCYSCQEMQDKRSTAKGAQNY